MKNPFTPPSYLTLARRHLDEARREHLAAVQNREYYEAIEAMYVKRIARITSFLTAADPQATHPPRFASSP